MSVIVLKSGRLTIINENDKKLYIDIDHLNGKVCCCSSDINVFYYADKNIVYDNKDNQLFELENSIRYMHLYGCNSSCCINIYCVDIHDNIYYYDGKNLSLFPNKAEDNFAMILCSKYVNGDGIYCMSSHILLDSFDRTRQIVSIIGKIEDNFEGQFYRKQNIDSKMDTIYVKVSDHLYLLRWIDTDAEFNFIDNNGEYILYSSSGIRHIHRRVNSLEVDSDVELYKPNIQFSSIKSARKV
jgi:hypothetical protein